MRAIKLSCSPAKLQGGFEELLKQEQEQRQLTCELMAEHSTAD